ncbi:ketopantoate reductase family protein [Syntrophothermus lipocalidus]|uniref:2-dehydropantoate 2-reductase n=1 Tax=Syntrophothermus lipocalidus (strain DSM 12680 / TGB-C1) TaxID=643648 RepID=D7CKJ1_SYNLT|nr:ketopantoate reductase family protein [Syntrophothermus lipocalidus]ADI01226.1 2-dehydropantoate 2-reductase [Syntrophothermus lipocalidus DSM 12680]
MRILVFGLGALGTVYACLLKNAGHFVVGIDREPVVSRVKTQGLGITGIWGEHTAFLDEVASTVDEVQARSFDLIVLTVKSFDTAEAASKLVGLAGAGTYVVLAQNGYGNYEAASAFLPPEQLIVARVIFGSETLEPGKAKVTVIADDVVIGSPQNLISEEVLAEIAEQFSTCGIPTRASNEVMKYVWGKIIYNSALNSLGAILEVPYGKLAENKYTAGLMDAMIDEIFAVLEASGETTLWADAGAYRQAFYGQMVPSTAQHHASMLQDIQRGRKTEIDALNGAVVELGMKLGIDTPVNRVIVSLVKAKEELSRQRVE